MASNEVIAKCLSAAQAELNKIPYKDDKLKLELVYTHYEYVNDKFIRVSEGDRGHIYRNEVAETEEEFIEYLIYKTVKSYAFAHECKVRRAFEDNRRQVNEIIVDCYGYIDDKYKYTLMVQLKDNIHIYFDLLDHYVRVSKKYLDSFLVSAEEKKRLSFVATKQYAGKSGGMYDVAFCFEWVRYHISCFLEKHPGKKETFLAHEEQFQRLLELEKTDPYNAERYQLGTWDKDVFAEAERILAEIVQSGARVLKHLPSGNVSESITSAYNCAFYMCIILLHTERNLEQDLERLLAMAKHVDITLFRKSLEQLFVTDEYAVFGRARAELRESARKALGM